MPSIADPRSQRFVEEYMVDMNATRAAVRAGYSPTCASTMGARLLKRPEVAQEIQRRKDFYAIETGVTVKWVIQRLKETYDKAMEEQPVYDAKGSPCGTEWKTGAVAVKSLELLGKHCGAFVERVELTGANGGPLEVRDLTDEDLLKRLMEIRILREQAMVEMPFEEVEEARLSLPEGADAVPWEDPPLEEEIYPDDSQDLD